MVLATTKLPWRLIPLLLLVVVPLVVSGCSGGASASSTGSKSGGSATEDRQYIATAIALKAKETVTPAARPSAPAGPLSAAQISTSAPSSGLLDNRHLAAGKGCDACHSSIPAEGKPVTPTTTKCLSCHGGSWEALIAKTSSLGTRNPHKAHTGRQDCDRCHHVHRPFEFSCNTCHTFAIPEKYQTASSSTSTVGSPVGAGGSSTAGGSGSPNASRVETED